MNDANLLEDQPIAWTPSPEVIERARLTKFMRQVGVSTWDELYAYSINNVERFTAEVLKFLDIKFDPPYVKLLDTSNGVEFPTWFARSEDTSVLIGGSPAEISSERRSDVREDKSVLAPSGGLNITTMCLDRWQTDEMKDQPAVIWEGEIVHVDSNSGDSDIESLDMTESSCTFGHLYDAVLSCSSGLRQFGIVKGDAVGIHMPMMVETVEILLALGHIGAIAVPVFSGYGVEAISSRLNAVGAKALFTCDRFPRRGKYFESLPIAVEAVKQLTSIQSVFVVERTTDPWIVDDNRFVSYDELVDKGLDENENLDEVEPTCAEDPLIILYTSGTTGKPKGIAHTHASFPIKAAQDMAFGTDVGKGTRISWYTDIGWMMGPWLIYGALINGATICIYDGAPDYPTPDRMWEFCAKHKVEVLGISPTLIRSLATHETATEETRTTSELTVRKGGLPPPASSSKQAGVNPPSRQSGARRPSDNDPAHLRHDLSALRAFASTGEPWNPAPWWWLFEKVGNSKLPIINYSGGTEISGGILMGNPLLPIKPCSFPAPCPGMDVDILDEDGNPVGPGKVGELVIKQPWIGMARGFWQENERYLDTYWRRFPGIWVHGDFAMRDKDGHWFILGRSDDTLKVAGKRVGPAEVESILVSHPQVVEVAVIGVPDEAKGTAMVAFCVLRSDDTPVLTNAAAAFEAILGGDEDKSVLAPLETELKALVARDMGKPLAPSAIHFVSALPKTRNAKVMRRVIRSAYLGEDPGDLSALENTECVEEIQGLGKRK